MVKFAKKFKFFSQNNFHTNQDLQNSGLKDLSAIHKNGSQSQLSSSGLNRDKAI